MTTTRYPGNPDFHAVPPRCANCGQFCGGFDADNPAIWERNDNYDLPDTHTCYCLDCAAERVLENYDVDDKEQAINEVLAAISGGGSGAE